MNHFELRQGEYILKTANGDCWETPYVHFQIPGQYTFTNQRILFRESGIFKKLCLEFELPYSEIDWIEPYLVVFFPTGIRVWMKNGDRYRLSLRGRKQYMDIIEKYQKVGGN